MAEAGSDEFGVTPDELADLSTLRDEQLVAVLAARGGTERLLGQVRSSGRGLAGDNADLARRRERFGENWIPPKKPKTFLGLLWEAFKDPILLLLTAGAFIGLMLWVASNQMDTEGKEKDEYGWIEPVTDTIRFPL
jgi:Ca2+ transporting ATPase